MRHENEAIFNCGFNLRFSMPFKGVPFFCIQMSQSTSKKSSKMCEIFLSHSHAFTLDWESIFYLLLDLGKNSWIYILLVVIFPVMCLNMDKVMFEKICQLINGVEFLKIILMFKTKALIGFILIRILFSIFFNFILLSHHLITVQSILLFFNFFNL